MLDELKSIDPQALEQLQALRQRQRVLADRLEKIEEKRDDVSPEVYRRVSEDYRSKAEDLAEEAAPFETQVAADARALGTGLDEARARCRGIELDLEEATLRHELGEYDEAAYEERQQELDARREDLQRDIEQAEETHDHMLDALPEALREQAVAKAIEEDRAAEAPDQDAERGDEDGAADAAEGDPAEDDPAEDDPAENDPAEDDPADDARAEDDPADDARAEDDPADDDRAEHDAAEAEGTGRSTVAGPAGDGPFGDDAPGDRPPSVDSDGIFTGPTVVAQGGDHGTAPIPDTPDRVAASGAPAPSPLPGGPLETHPTTEPPLDLPPPPSSLPDVPPASGGDLTVEMSAQEAGDGNGPEPSEDATRLLDLSSMPDAPSPPADEPPGATRIAPVATMTFRDDDGERHIYPLRLEPMTIGRTADNDIPVSGLTVSRRHARIEISQDGFKLVDLGSENGVFVNGEQIREHILRDGDEIHIGSAEKTLVFETSG